MTKELQEKGFIRFYRRWRGILLIFQVIIFLILHVTIQFPLYIILLVVGVTLVKLLPYNKWLDRGFLNFGFYKKLSEKRRQKIVLLSYFVILTALKLFILDQIVLFVFDMSISQMITNNLFI